MDAREERLARNEVLFRDVNEGIEELAVKQHPDAHVFEFFCECSNVDCTLRLPMRLDTYERVRSDPTLFLAALGHELPEIEIVVEITADYQVVKKEGEAASIAADGDPRT
jgi:hypothetical protein